MSTASGAGRSRPEAGYQVSRLNAVRHGVLSRYTVLALGGGGRIPEPPRSPRDRAQASRPD